MDTQSTSELAALILAAWPGEKRKAIELLARGTLFSTRGLGELRVTYTFGIDALWEVSVSSPATGAMDVLAAHRHTRDLLELGNKATLLSAFVEEMATAGLSNATVGDVMYFVEERVRAIRVRSPETSFAGALGLILQELDEASP